MATNFGLYLTGQYGILLEVMNISVLYSIPVDGKSAWLK